MFNTLQLVRKRKQRSGCFRWDYGAEQYNSGALLWDIRPLGANNTRQKTPASKPLASVPCDARQKKKLKTSLSTHVYDTSFVLAVGIHHMRRAGLSLARTTAPRCVYLPQLRRDHQPNRNYYYFGSIARGSRCHPRIPTGHCSLFLPAFTPVDSWCLCATTCLAFVTSSMPR